MSFKLVKFICPECGYTELYENIITSVKSRVKGFIVHNNNDVECEFDAIKNEDVDWSNADYQTLNCGNCDYEVDACDYNELYDWLKEKGMLKEK